MTRVRNLALLASAAAILLAAGPAQAQDPDPLWSATLTVGDLSPDGHGCQPVAKGQPDTNICSNRLTDHDFTVNSKTAVIQRIQDYHDASGDQLQIEFVHGANIATELRGKKFCIGTTGEHTVPSTASGHGIVWGNTDAGWSTGDQLYLSIGNSCPSSVVTLSASPTTVTEGSSVTVTATLSPTLPNQVTIPLTIADGTAEGSDHGTLTGIVVAANATSGTGAITTAQDADTDDETFTVSLGTLPSAVAPGAASSVGITITDDDESGSTPNAESKPTARISASPNPVSEGSSVTVTATLSSVLPSAVSIPLTVTPGTASEDDYGTLSDITIPASSLSGTSSLDITEDGLSENRETFTVALGTLPSSVTEGAPSSAQVTIRWNPRLEVSADPPCGDDEISDTSVAPTSYQRIYPTPHRQVSLQLRWLTRTAKGEWRDARPAFRDGFTTRMTHGKLDDLRSAYPGFRGFEYRIKDAKAATAECTWRFSGDDGGSRTDTDTGGGQPGDDETEPSSSCTLVAPFWSGPTGGFTVKPEAGSNSVSVTCGRRTTERESEDGLVTRIVQSACKSSPFSDGELGVQGAAPGGWYWQHGSRNAAVAPFVCQEQLGGAKAVVPGGVQASARDGGTWFHHDTARLAGIVPHFSGNDCDEYVTPYWHGDGGVVVRPREGRETVGVKVECGATFSTMSLRSEDGSVVSELVRKDFCTDEEGGPRQGKLTVTGAAPGGWYWVDGEKNAAVAPLMCADLLGGSPAVDPGGVTYRRTDDGTFFKHDTDRLIGIVPHLSLEDEED